MSRSRKSAWLRDELILCLDLYRREGASPSREMREDLSEVLRSIQVEPELASDPGFRSYSSIGWKLANFATLDPRTGSERSHGARGDREVWDEFWDDPERLAETVKGIRGYIGRPAPPTSGLDEVDGAEAPEGRVLTLVHRTRERNLKVVKAKKRKVLSEQGRLDCEVCRFDFNAFYGARGHGFIECHHLLPLCQLDPGHPTRLEELALVCSNCHRMIHRERPWLSLPELRESVIQHGGRI